MTYRLRVLSLGAGVQSTTILLKAIQGEYAEPPDVAIFADTQWEPQAVYDHLAWLEREVAGRIPIYRVTAGSLRENVLQRAQGSQQPFPMMPFFVRHDGGRGQLRRQCTDNYKIRPVRQQIRTLLGLQPRQRMKGTVQLWLGISLDEVGRMKPNRTPWLENYYPLVEEGVTREGCLAWLAAHDYPAPPKSSCIACPYHRDPYWRALQAQNPSDWAEVVGVDNGLRHSGRGILQNAYLHQSLQPLEAVDLRTEREKGQLTIEDFLGECEGMCGV